MAAIGSAFLGLQVPHTKALALGRSSRCLGMTRAVMTPRKSQLDSWQEEQNKSNAFEKLQSVANRQSRNRDQKVGESELLASKLFDAVRIRLGTGRSQPVI